MVAALLCSWRVFPDQIIPLHRSLILSIILTTTDNPAQARWGRIRKAMGDRGKGKREEVGTETE